MKNNKAWGVYFYAYLFILAGGFSLFIMLVAVIDSVSAYGFSSLRIMSAESITGIVNFIVMPLLVYSTGIGLLFRKSWAQRSVKYVLPVCSVFLLSDLILFCSYAIIMASAVVYFSKLNCTEIFT